ncbi:hypothetical protein [Anaplasma centrale]|nr:hypothetical protein [Anaplasma centrale]
MPYKTAEILFISRDKCHVVWLFFRLHGYEVLSKDQDPPLSDFFPTSA